MMIRDRTRNLYRISFGRFLSFYAVQQLHFYAYVWPRCSFIVIDGYGDGRGRTSDIGWDAWNYHLDYVNIIYRENGSCKSRGLHTLRYQCDFILDTSYFKTTLARTEVLRSNIKDDDRESELHFEIKYSKCSDRHLILRFTLAFLYAWNILKNRFMQIVQFHWKNSVWRARVSFDYRIWTRGKR